MAFITVRPTKSDKRLAGFVARHVDSRTEKIAETLSWGADEHILLAGASLLWLATRNAKEDDVKRVSTHVLLSTLAASLLPHLIKLVIDQERPDRCTVAGHLRGIPLSGNAKDAFPSGHALHMGALASAATLLPSRSRNLVWMIAGILVGTRVVLLAHWLTDVLAGLSLGIGVERAMRLFTRPRPIRFPRPTRGGRTAQHG